MSKSRKSTLSFAERLIAARKRAGLTQAQASEILEVGLRTYSMWEREENAKKAPLVVTQEGSLARLEALPEKK